MSGLILKDVFNLMNQGKQILLMLIFFGICFSGTSGSGSVIAMCTIACTVFVITSFSMDETCHWTEYAFIMPIRRQQLVLSKYIVSFLFSLFGIAAGFVMSVAIGAVKGEPISFEVLLSAAGTGIVVAMLFTAFLIPITIRFGVNKGRFVIMGLAAVPVLIGTFLGDRLEGMLLEEGALDDLLFFGVAAIAVLVVLSYFVSCMIIKRKEF